MSLPYADALLARQPQPKYTRVSQPIARSAINSVRGRFKLTYPQAEGIVLRYMNKGSLDNRQKKFFKAFKAEFLTHRSQRSRYLQVLEARRRRNPPRQRPRRQRRFRRIAADHGLHYRHLDNLDDYIKYYIYNTAHRGHKQSGSLFDFLVKQFNQKKWYSLKTKRWSKYL